MTTSDLGNVKFGMGGANLGFGWAENALTCDSEGNCMLKDELKLSAERHQQIRKNLGKTAKAVGKGVGKVAKAGANFAGTKVLPKVTRAFTGGKVGATVRIRDELVKIGGKIGRISGSIKFDDDDLVDDLSKAGDRIRGAFKKVGSGIAKGAKGVGKSIKKAVSRPKA